MKRSLTVAGFALVALGCAAMPLRAGDNKAPVNDNGTAVEEEQPKNWIELGIGGLNVSGDDAQFKQEHHVSGDVYGGIQDLHYQKRDG